MNCSYRILKDVHIGQRVRKTKDKTTVPFKNDPLTNMKLKKWNDQGFELEHPDLPRNIWVDFYQLPLDQLNIEMGVIKNPITFVESILRSNTTSMVLVRADTLDYMEMLHDKKEKDISKKYKIKDLKPGDRVISCICKDSNIMVYMGTFNVAAVSSSYRYGGDSSYIDETPERAFFAYENSQGKGKYSIKGYPLTNKIVVEVYKASDKDLTGINEDFLDEADNIVIIQDINCIGKYGHYSYPVLICNELKKTYPKYDFDADAYNNIVYVQKSKIDIRKNAVKFIKANNISSIRNGIVHETKEDAASAYNNRYRY